ncbi:MAG: hypothetical protein AABP62_25735 [Planctomycetota bacterium]
MTDPRSKRLRMIAGPNGSGKSSIVRGLSKEGSPTGLFSLNHYLNADDVAGYISGDGLNISDFGIDVTLAELSRSIIDGGRLPAEHPFLLEARLDHLTLTAPRDACDGYAAAAVVDFIRERLMVHGKSMSFETVMSHPSKIEFFARARTAGYKTYLYFICLDSVELNVLRVQSRVRRGGHDVPEDKIRERYSRCLDLVGSAVVHCYRSYFFDNSGPKHIWLAECDSRGTCHLQVDQSKLPSWFQTSWFKKVVHIGE